MRERGRERRGRNRGKEGEVRERGREMIGSEGEEGVAQHSVA